MLSWDYGLWVMFAVRYVLKTESNTTHRHSLSVSALGFMSTKTAAGKFIRKETIGNNLGTFKKNFGRRKYPNGQTSRTNLLQ